MKWTLSIDEDGVVTIPDEMMEALGWNDGTVLEFIDKKDGSFEVIKVNEYK